MQFVKKGKSPSYFEEEKKLAHITNDPAWDNLHCKKDLRKHLAQEQYELCVYCERDLTQSRHHIEHVIPRSFDSDRTFDYFNLAASCNGDQNSEDSCGGIKKGTNSIPKNF